MLHMRRPRPSECTGGPQKLGEAERQLRFSTQGSRGTPSKAQRKPRVANPAARPSGNGAPRREGLSAPPKATPYDTLNPETGAPQGIIRGLVS